jgi:4-amino-4-deoxy-L-arabinose transferase-like glycosyltransferase
METARTGLTVSQRDLLLGRLTIAILGAATVWVLYGIGCNLWNRKIGLLSAALLAFTGYHVANCHWLKNDISTVFFMTVALFFISKIFTTAKLRYYILSPIFCALAINSKYNVLPIIIVMVVAHCLRSGSTPKEIRKSLISPKLILALLILLAALIASFPLIYLDFNFFRSHVFSYIVTKPGVLLLGGPKNPFWKVRYLNLISFFSFSFPMKHGMGIYLTLLGLGGLILSLLERQRRQILCITFPIIYLILAIMLASPGIRLQDTIPLYPFAALLSSVLIYTLLKWLLKKGGC